MTFAAYEESQAGASRVELYTLTIGSTIYRMHDSVELVLNIGGDDFFRVQISRGAIATGQESLEISLPGSHEFSLQFASIAPGQTAILTIQAYHRNDPATEVKVIYKGVVRSVAFTQNASHSALSLSPINDALDKQIPERTFQAACNNVLFDTDCKISAGSYEHTNLVSAIVDNIVTVTALESTKGDGWSTGGYVSYGTLDYRLILEQDGDDLILVLPFHTNVTGQSVTVFAGCDHSIGVCSSKFSNVINFGGCPYVPTKNIFLTGIR